MKRIKFLNLERTRMIGGNCSEGRLEGGLYIMYSMIAINFRSGSIVLVWSLDV